MKIYILRHGTTEWNNKHLIQGQTDIHLDEFGKIMAKATGEGLKNEGIHFDKVYSSPLSRACETARIILSCLNDCPVSTIEVGSALSSTAPSLPDDHATSASATSIQNDHATSASATSIITDNRLKELHFGFMDGGKVEEMQKDETSPFKYFKSAPDKYEDAVAHWKQDHSKEFQSASSQTPELLSELCLRAKDFMVNEIEHLPENSSVLISAHGALSKALLMYIRGESDLSKFWGDGLLPNCGLAIVDLSMHKNSPVYTIINEARVFYSEDIQKKAPKLL